jgi:hypothetical protein
MKKSKLERVPTELLEELKEVKRTFGLTINTEAYRKISFLSKKGREQMQKKRMFDENWGW